MAWVREIVARQQPFTIGVDGNDRTMWSCNYNITISDLGGGALEDIIAARLVTAGLGTLGTTLFIGPAAVLPTSNGPFTSIIHTGGRYALETHNGTQYTRPTFQIVVRAKSYVAGRTQANAVHTNLHGVRNTTMVA